MSGLGDTVTMLKSRREDDLFDKQITILSALGVTFPNRRQTRQPWNWVIYSIVNAIVILSCICHAMSLVENVGSSSDKAVKVMLLLVNATTLFKLTLTRFNSELLSELFDQLNELTTNQSTDLLKKIGFVNRLYVTLISALLAGCLFTPWISDDKMASPLTLWTPFKVDSGPVFFAVYSFACLNLTIVAYTTKSVDTLLLHVAGLICRRLDSIGAALSTIGNETISTKGRWKPRGKRWKDYRKTRLPLDSLGLSVTKLAFQGRDETMLGQCIREHSAVIRLVRTYDIVVDDIFLVQVVQSTIVSAMLLFALSKLEDKLREILLMISIIVGNFLQFIIYCWLGEEISNHNDQIHRSLYMNRWYDCDERVMKSLVIVETFTKNHFRLQGGHLFAMNFSTFALVVKESFGLFMVLRAVT